MDDIVQLPGPLEIPSNVEIWASMGYFPQVLPVIVQPFGWSPFYVQTSVSRAVVRSLAPVRGMWKEFTFRDLF